MIIGTWGNSDDGGKTFWAYDKYSSDGTVFSWGEVPDSDIKYEVSSKFEIKTVKGGYLSCLTITATSHSDMMPIGYHWCDKIIKLTNKEFTYMKDSGKSYTIYKINDE